jgi:hypothetical protein
MSTLQNAIDNDETVALPAQQIAGVQKYQCGCGMWRPAFALNDVRASPAFTQDFVCENCLTKELRQAQVIGEAIMAAMANTEGEG